MNTLGPYTGFARTEVCFTEGKPLETDRFFSCGDVFYCVSPRRLITVYLDGTVSYSSLRSEYGKITQQDLRITDGWVDVTNEDGYQFRYNLPEDTIAPSTSQTNYLYSWGFPGKHWLEGSLVVNDFGEIPSKWYASSQPHYIYSSGVVESCYDNDFFVLGPNLFEGNFYRDGFTVKYLTDPPGRGYTPWPWNIKAGLEKDGKAVFLGQVTPGKYFLFRSG